MESLKSKLNWLWVLIAILVGAILIPRAPFFQAPSTHTNNSEVCRNHTIQGVKEGLIVKSEDQGARVYVSELWDRMPLDEQTELGYYLALCRSETEKTEIIRNSDGKSVGRYVIDLHYRMQNGLPVQP